MIDILYSNDGESEGFQGSQSGESWRSRNSGMCVCIVCTVCVCVWCTYVCALFVRAASVNGNSAEPSGNSN